jgi:Baseplate J-like protein
MANRCSCCTGTQAATPLTTANRPGLNALVYRAGTHFTFFETMKARLSNLELKITDFDQQASPLASDPFPLHNLKTRDVSDPAIALLDAWAIVGDVLTFYQERIANEGYLRTATERRSISELARLIGYELRPGVAASVYLAYTLDDNSEPLEISAGARSQSVPGPGELPQSFEISDPLPARKEWNNLKPRMTRPQNITEKNAQFITTIYFEGTATNLKLNDPLLFVFEQANSTILRKIASVEPQFPENRTKVTLQLTFGLEAFRQAVSELIAKYKNPATFCVAQDELASEVLRLLNVLSEALTEDTVPEISKTVFSPLLVQVENADKAGNAEAQKWIEQLLSDLTLYLRALRNAKGKRGPEPGTRAGIKQVTAFESFINLARPLLRRASIQPDNSARLDRNVKAVFDTTKDLLPQMVTAFNPRLDANTYRAWAKATVTPPSPVTVYAMRATALLFGNNAPRRIIVINKDTGKIEKTGEWPLVTFMEIIDGPNKGVPVEDKAVVDLDGSNEKILPDSWVVVDKSQVPEVDPKKTNFERRKVPDILITKVETVTPKMSRAGYGLTSQITRIQLTEPWLEYKENRVDFTDKPEEEVEFQLIRRTIVYAQSESLTLSEEPIGEDICGDRIELGYLLDGLKSGRWFIVSGERADVPGTSGVRASELVMLVDVEQNYDKLLPGDKVHSTLILANSLAYTYKRDTVIIYGNVVKATHGETRNEVLGAGDASKALQEFTLKQPPLTYVSAPTIKGIASTLHVYVNEVEWHETASLAGLAPADHKFITLTDDEAKTKVIFGNGREGARLPTGLENVKAVYRNGIGKAGNVQAGQISLLTTRPLGVKEVINPLRASGGADKESRDQGRRNAPLAVMSLDRLVSTQDYADFARTFAGIGKASAARLSDGHRRLVHLTIAGADDIPIDERSDLYQNLRQSFGRFGDPFQAVQIDVRELVALVISANVRLLPDYQWESVEPKVRRALLSRFSFDERELGQPVFLSEVISTVQQVKGVAYVDVDLLDGVSETDVTNPSTLSKKLEPPPDQTGTTGQVVQPRQHIRLGLAQTAAMDPERAKLTPDKSIFPAQLAILLPGVPDTLILNLVKEVQ